ASDVEQRSVRPPVVTEAQHFVAHDAHRLDVAGRLYGVDPFNGVAVINVESLHGVVADAEQRVPMHKRPSGLTNLGSEPPQGKRVAGEIHQLDTAVVL